MIFRQPRGPLLIPCIDVYHPDVAWHLAFFAESERPWRIASFVQWADGDAAGHESMWRELYRKPPVLYLSALGDKPWLPCLWRPAGFWEYQVDLARKIGAGVSLSNGWMEYAGLSRLIPATRERILKDLAELRRLRAPGLPSKADGKSLYQCRLISGIAL